MCLLVTRAPASSLASSCLEDLATVERMFEVAAAADSKPAFNNLVRDQLLYVGVTKSRFIHTFLFIYLGIDKETPGERPRSYP